MSQKVLFIDRDGTLIEEPEDFQVDALHKIRLVAGVIPALLTLADHGYRFVMVSNQDGLGTESFPAEQFESCHAHTLALFEQSEHRWIGLEARHLGGGVVLDGQVEPREVTAPGAPRPLGPGHDPNRGDVQRFE